MLCVMLSSISVAVMTRLPSRRHLPMSSFWMLGSSSYGTSTPMSPRAIMMPAHSVKISSMLSMPGWFSILAMTLMSSPPLARRKALRSARSCLRDTKDAATKSTSFSMPKSRSRLSCSLRKSCLSTLFGKLMLLRSDSTPPAVTRQMTSVSVVAVTVRAMSPSLTSTVSPASRSLARPG